MIYPDVTGRYDHGDESDLLVISLRGDNWDESLDDLETDIYDNGDDPYPPDGTGYRYYCDFLGLFTVYRCECCHSDEGV